jgi:hypothetical protein
MKISDALALASAPSCPIKPPVLRGFSGGASTAEQRRMRLMAAVLASMRSSVIGPTPASQIGRSKTGTLVTSATFATERCGARPGGHPVSRQRVRAIAPSQQAGADRIIVATPLKVLHARLVLAISPSWRNSPSGRSPVSQDAASAYEIAPGVAFGSLLPGVVTRVT